MEVHQLRKYEFTDQRNPSCSIEEIPAAVLQLIGLWLAREISQGWPRGVLEANITTGLEKLYTTLYTDCCTHCTHCTLIHAAHTKPCTLLICLHCMYTVDLCTLVEKVEASIKIFAQAGSHRHNSTFIRSRQKGFNQDFIKRYVWQ